CQPVQRRAGNVAGLGGLQDAGAGHAAAGRHRHLTRRPAGLLHPDPPEAQKAMSAQTLHISGLTVGYGSRFIIRDLNVSPIAAGGVTALVGPNGAGKSTLLRAIAGLLPATGKVV